MRALWCGTDGAIKPVYPVVTEEVRPCLWLKFALLRLFAPHIRENIILYFYISPCSAGGSPSFIFPAQHDHVPPPASSPVDQSVISSFVAGSTCSLRAMWPPARSRFLLRALRHNSYTAERDMTRIELKSGRFYGNINGDSERFWIDQTSGHFWVVMTTDDYV